MDSADADFLKELQQAFSEEAAEHVQTIVAGLLAVADPVKASSGEAIAALHADGIEVVMLTGDNAATARSVADQIGLDRVIAEVLPADKADAVAALRAEGEVVAMVGDGVNDAAALAAATVGIGVHGGAEAALAAADVYLGAPGLEPLVRLLDGADRTLGVIRRNLVFSLAYNAVAVTLAIAGFMHPLVAAILMPASSITVVVSSYRAKTFV